jgi:hypothetical protein
MKKIIFLLSVLTMVFSFSSTAFAVVTYQVRTNFTWDTAQEMLRNQHTAVLYWAVDDSQQQVIAGSLYSNTEENWYKIYLPADSANTYLSINCKDLTADVYDSNLNRIFTRRYVKHATRLGARPYQVNIPTTGYYYIKLYNCVGSDGAYRMTMGSPNYNSSSYTYTAPTALTLTPSIKSVEATYNLSNISTIEPEAIAYQVYLSGLRSGSLTSESRSIRYRTDSTFTAAPLSATWKVTIPLTANKLVVNEWFFRWAGNTSSSSTLTPQLVFWYVYPELPILWN